MHEQVFQAISAHDPSLAEESMRKMLTQTLEFTGKKFAGADAKLSG
jgi:DNA-binding GntR family transcriptional regulator